MHRLISKHTHSSLAGILLSFFVGLIFLFPHAEAGARDLVIGLETSAERLIPIAIKSPQTFPVSMQIYEGLFDVDEKGNVIPRVIEKWETKDYRTWTFHVRKGVRFHRSPLFKNGTRELTAKDVLYSLTRFCSAESYSSFLVLDYLEGAREYNQGKADTVRGLEVIGPHTLRVKLVKPVPFFINHISTPVLAVFPQELDQKEYAGKAGLTLAVGTGPYVFKSMTDTEIVLEKNPHYWNRKTVPQVDRIVFRVIKHDQTRLASLIRGNIDLMVLPSSLYSSVFNRDGSLADRFSANYQVKSVATFNSHLIGINNKAISDPNLRRAMFWATDRAQMVASILYGHADVAPGTVPPGINGYEPPFRNSSFDLTKARDYLARSSYKGEPIELLVHDLANSEQIGQIFQAQMAKIGITITLNKMDYGSVIGRMVKGESRLFSMFFEYAFSSPEPILINLFSTAKIPVPNFFQFSDPSVDAMLADLYKLSGIRKSVMRCAEIEARIMEEAPAIFLYRQKYLILHSRDLTGLEVSGNNHYFFEKVRFSR